MGSPLGLGKAIIHLEIHLPNPVVLASAQGFHEIIETFQNASNRIEYLESLLLKNGIEYARPTSKAVLPEPSGSAEK